MKARIKINSSKDFNDYFPKKVEEEHSGFNNGVNDQTSHVYESPVYFTGAPTVLTCIGSEPAGRDGDMYTELSTITTANNIVETVTATGKR